MTVAVGHHQVIYNGGAQTLLCVPRNRQAKATVVTTCTYRIVDLRVSEDDPLRLIASGNASIDTTSTTTSDMVGVDTANPRQIPVASSAGFVVGRQYLLLAADGTRELVLADAVGTGYVTARNEIAKLFASGVTLRGIEVSCVFPSLEAADETKFQNSGGPYAVDWSWDLDPSPRREIAFVIRQADDLVVTEEEVLAIDPTLNAVTGERLSLTTAIRTAAQEIRAKCQANQVDPDYFYGSTSLRLAVAWRAVWHILRQKPGEGNDARTKEAKEESQGYLDAVLIGRPPEKSVKVDPVTDSAPAGTSKPYHHWQVLS